MVQVVALAGVAIVALAAALLYRTHHRREVLTQGTVRARELMRADTWAGYRAASQVLEPLVAIDAMEAGALRAQALAMLAADYRDEAAAVEAERLLDAPGARRRDPARRQPGPGGAGHGPRAGRLGRHLGRPRRAPAPRGACSRAGSRSSPAIPPGPPSSPPRPWPPTRDCPPRWRSRGTRCAGPGRPEGARQAYLAALHASPGHPRATYGLAKLALSGKARPEEAYPALERHPGRPRRHPGNERGRAALHLAALQGRAGDRAGAQRTLDASGATGADRAWLEKAVAEEELSRTGYRVVDGAPAGLQSASDDDPYVPAPPAPPPPPPEPPRRP